jgi:hypothetical protein
MVGSARQAPAQIVEVTGCLAVTARGRLHRARRRFRAVFAELSQSESLQTRSSGTKHFSPRRIDENVV